MGNGYTVDDTRTDDVMTVRVPVDGKDWNQRFLLIADLHIDNPHCDRHLLRRHLDEAKEEDAGVMIFGDLFDVMQARQDRRHTKSSLKDQYARDDYFNAVIDDACDFLEPYAENIVMVSEGNHETAITKHHEINLLSFLADRLNIPKMGYSGFIRFMFARKDKKTSGTRSTRNLFFHHGSGGGGPVTKGVIRTNRQAVWLPDADIIVGGHIHEAWQLEIPRVRLSSGGVVRHDTQLHVQLPTYKQEHTLAGGWHIERGAPPKPLGGQWLEFFYRWNQPGRVAHRVYRAN